MEAGDYQAYLLAKTGAVEEFPFDALTSVYKVGGKMFALAGWNETPLQITLKCDPEEAETLRAAYPAVQPGYHMNKRHWNTVTLDGTVPEDELRDMIDASYRLVVQSLPKSARESV